MGAVRQTHEGAVGAGLRPHALREILAFLQIQAGPEEIRIFLQPARRAHPTENFPEKYNRSAMENARQLQCKALCELEKSRRRKNNCEQWKKQCAEQSKTVGHQGDR
jgi:hypothetical protein